MSAGARSLPAALKPELATLVASPPREQDDDWLYEIKFDGYRMLTRIDSKKIQLITRNGNDWTARLKPLESAVNAMALPDGWYDGEIVVLDDRGLPNFNLLQLAFDNSKTRNIVYYLFDAPFATVKTFDPSHWKYAAINWRAPSARALLRCA